MERINPASFYGPRAYFTDFDYRIMPFKRDKEVYRREVERRLKILLLTKNTVRCAASHMVNEFAYNLFKDNPILLTEKMIIPGLRKDLEHITDYLDEKTSAGKYAPRKFRIANDLKEEMKIFYREYVNKVVDWELMENTTWFRATILKALKDENSVIRRNLPSLSKGKLDSLLSEIERGEILSRGIILESISTWSKREKRILLNFVNLIYHMSGARVTNCESALPQENYIDYSLTDFSEHRVALSDTQIFLKIFFELAFETLSKHPLPVELLDLLSFEDINHLRKPIEKSLFRKKYDELIQKSVQVIRKSETDPEDVVYDIEEPLEILEQVSKTFDEIFKQELPEFLKRKHKETTKELQKTTLSLGLGVAGLIPYVGSVATTFSLLQSSCETFVNLNQSLRSKREIHNRDLYLKNKERVLRQLIEKYPISEKSALLDTLDLLVNTISTKIKL
jgi:hypothetical protein